MRRETQERREAVARKLLAGSTPTWREALALADEQLQCGARTRAGTPCKRKGVGRGGRCVKHGGASTGPRTPEGRASSGKRISAYNRTPEARELRRKQLRIGNRWAQRVDG